jgi:hypothetical protein
MLDLIFNDVTYRDILFQMSAKLDYHSIHALMTTSIYLRNAFKSNDRWKRLISIAQGRYIKDKLENQDTSKYQQVLSKIRFSPNYRYNKPYPDDLSYYIIKDEPLFVRYIIRKKKMPCHELKDLVKIACMAGSIKVVKYFINHKSLDITFGGQTCLIDSIRYDQIEILKLLLSTNKFDFSLNEYLCLRIIPFAANYKVKRAEIMIEVLKSLVEHGLDLNRDGCINKCLDYLSTSNPEYIIYLLNLNIPSTKIQLVLEASSPQDYHMKIIKHVIGHCSFNEKNLLYVLKSGSYNGPSFSINYLNLAFESEKFVQMFKKIIIEDTKELDLYVVDMLKCNKLHPFPEYNNMLKNLNSETYTTLDIHLSQRPQYFRYNYETLVIMNLAKFSIKYEVDKHLAKIFSRIYNETICSQNLITNK